MKSTKNRQAIIAVTAVFLFFFMAFPSHAAQTEAAKAQEQMGKEIKDAARLRWQSGRIQTATGQFILDGGQNGRVSQEALGSGIAAAAHLNFKFMKNQEQMGATILRTVSMKNKKIISNKEGDMQVRLGRFIASTALALQTQAGASQAAMGQKIQNQAQIKQVLAMMSKTAYANLQGDSTQEISGSMLSLLRSSKAFEHERNFRLAMTLLENETGRPMTQIFEGSSRGGGTLTSKVTYAGLGGFAEYGLLSIAAFLYVGWVFSVFLSNLGFPKEAEEEDYQYPEAA
ncbi:MAG: hypothetical protein GXO96_02035 [Nitrospirae bacterium]|nr:hypothetical protein [Candidatus Manganitrophaceae bacterium]